MFINLIFAIIGIIFFGGALVLFLANSNFLDSDSAAHNPRRSPLLFLGIVLCISAGLACFIVVASIRECPNCGTITENNYCSECGHQVLETEQSPKCSECGANTKVDTIFCGCCGNKLK